MSYTRRITVLTNRPDLVADYLYSHTVEIGRQPEGAHTRLTLLTTADESQRVADYFAQVQADRLLSGWHAAKLLDD